ncbi:MAG: hypothetical protein LBV49_11260 [Azonexus sp.]|jgi:hypothetical protein|nr:hypothetical protein [Azonexus sp.]
MKHTLCLLAVLAAASITTPAAFAYSGNELRADCQAADTLHNDPNYSDPALVASSARCLGYVMGFADGYAISDYLAEKVGVRLAAFCLPKDENLPHRLIRAVLSQFDRLPPKSDGSPATLTAAALARSFPCAIEPDK